jgi:hypothetical protein
VSMAPNDGDDDIDASFRNNAAASVMSGCHALFLVRLERETGGGEWCSPFESEEMGEFIWN